MSSNENVFPIHDEEAFEEDWQVYGGTGVSGDGSAGSKGQFVDLGDANSSSDPVTIGGVDDTSDRINNEEAFEEDWQVYGGTGVSGDGSAGSKGQFVDLTPKETDA